MASCDVQSNKNHFHDLKDDLFSFNSKGQQYYIVCSTQLEVLKSSLLAQCTLQENNCIKEIYWMPAGEICLLFAI